MKVVKNSSQKTEEEKTYIGQNIDVFMIRKSKKKELINICIYLVIILIILLLLINYLIPKSKKINDKPKIFTNKHIFILNNDTIVYNNKSINDDANFSKYQKMLPHLNPDSNDNPQSIKEIFNARQIYISDIRITSDYIKYIRPINETEELKYKKPYSENETIIDNRLFVKRPDQINYIDFCKIALDEKLIDNNTIEYDNKPIISIVIPSYNKQDMLLKSIRSIQNQNFKNIEIIIVNDCSTDNSSKIFNYLLETDPRIRIFHHIKNMGLFRSRLDGILYSRGKYIITFDTGDIYEDNYVLLDAYNVIDKYNLDSIKFLFRIIRSFNNLANSLLFFRVGQNNKIVYEPNNIKNLNSKVFNVKCL